MMSFYPVPVGSIRGTCAPWLVAGLLVGAASVAHAADAYIALGDSITFGETDLIYRQSLGDRGYVARVADALAVRTGARPVVANLAIDGETASSFMTGIGRTPPVVGRTDVPLALENLNYDAAALATQGQRFASTVASQAALGNTVSTVTVTLGFNDLGALAGLPTAAALAQIPSTLATYRTNYTQVLTQVRSLLPSANLFLLGYFNPFPADPGSPAAPIFNTAGVQLNGIIRDLASLFSASFVDSAAPFLGHEAEYTYLDEQPHGASVPDPFGGVLPIGNVHPNERGYDVIGQQVIAVSAVPEPSTWAILVLGFGAGVARLRRARSSRQEAS